MLRNKVTVTIFIIDVNSKKKQFAGMLIKAKQRQDGFY